jgi:hypothetical protein
MNRTLFQAERNSMEHTSMDAISSKINLRAKDNLVTWISCMGSLQTLMKESGDQLYRYYRFFRSLILSAVNREIHCACNLTLRVTMKVNMSHMLDQL